MRDWRERSGAGAASPPARGSSGARWGQSGGRGTSGANWGPSGGRGNSGVNWGAGGSRGNSGTNWGAPGGRDASDARSGSGRYRSSVDDYQEVDLERALVPGGGMLPAEMGGALPGMPGGPLVPGMPSEEDERMLGIRRPVYIPAVKEKKYKLGRWRIISGVLSVVLMCVAAASVAGFFGQKYLAKLNTQVGIYNTPSSINYSGVPATPVATAGPAAKYLTNVVTAKGITSDSSQNQHPNNITSKFLVNDQVFLFADLARNVPKGAHTVCVQWFINGQDIQPSGSVCVSFNCDGTICRNTADNNTAGGPVFIITYEQPGVGMARLFWDRPANDTSPGPNDPTLAATISFGIYMPATPTPVPTNTPKATGTKTPGATASPTK